MAAIPTPEPHESGNAVRAAAGLSVSVITPSWNQGEYLARTLASVASQSPPVLEHFIADAGSTDGTLALLRAAPPPVRWISEPDRGQAHAVNKAIAATRGDIIGWLNSDDIYYPDAIARAVRSFESDPGVDVVYGQADHIDAHDVRIGDYPTEPFDAARLREFCFICQPAAFIRRRCFDTYGPLDERLHYCMDYEYWLRLARGGARFTYLRERLAGSRLHEGAKTLRARVPVHREINDMLLRTLGRVPDRWLLGYGGVLAAQRVDPRARPRLHALAGGLIALGASIRWNHRISIAMGTELLRGAQQAAQGRMPRPPLA